MRWIGIIESKENKNRAGRNSGGPSYGHSHRTRGEQAPESMNPPKPPIQVDPNARQNLNSLKESIANGQRLSQGQLMKNLVKMLGGNVTNYDTSYYFSRHTGSGILRIANHCGDANEFARRHEYTNNYGVVLLFKNSLRRFKPDNRVDYNEYVYLPIHMKKDIETKIIDAILNWIDGGVCNLPNGHKHNESKRKKETQNKQSNKQIQEENTMKFKRYIKEANMSRRERIASAIQNRKNRQPQDLRDKYKWDDKTQYIWEEIEKFFPKAKEMGETIKNVQECGENILFEKWFTKYLIDAFDDDGVCIKYDDYVFVVYPNGTFVVFFDNIPGKYITYYFEGEDYHNWVYDCIGDIGYNKDDESKIDNINRNIRDASKSVSLFDKFEDAFYDYVEKKLNED